MLVAACGLAWAVWVTLLTLAIVIFHVGDPSMLDTLLALTLTPVFMAPVATLFDGHPAGNEHDV